MDDGFIPLRFKFAYPMSGICFALIMVGGKLFLVNIWISINWWVFFYSIELVGFNT